jgi:hypothetical protein
VSNGSMIMNSKGRVEKQSWCILSKSPNFSWSALEKSGRIINVQAES